MNAPLIDSHVHIARYGDFHRFEGYRRKHGFDYLNMVCLECHKGNAEYRAGNNLLGAALKLENPNLYVHAGLIYPVQPVTHIPEDWELGEQAKTYMEIGFDGMKIIESKPAVQKCVGTFLDDPIYDSFFRYLEEQGSHIVWHTGDPETFWEKDKAPAFCFENDWFYGDGTFGTCRRFYEAVESVLERFPKLNATFAHFLFYSNFPEKLTELLEKYPNIAVDITPGSEMYDAFTREYDYWREFFEAYSHRIVFGTDISCGAGAKAARFEASSDNLQGTVRRFLTTDDLFENWDIPIRGMKLSQKAVDNIMGGNFARRVGPAPRELNREALGRYVEKALPLVEDPGLRSWYAAFFEEKL